MWHWAEARATLLRNVKLVPLIATAVFRLIDLLNQSEAILTTKLERQAERGRSLKQLLNILEASVQEFVARFLSETQRGLISDR